MLASYDVMGHYEDMDVIEVADRILPVTNRTEMREAAAAILEHYGELVTVPLYELHDGETYGTASHFNPAAL